METVKHKFTRQELFDLVWQEPMTTLAKKFEISDVGLRKVCIKMQVPIPPIGHWQKVRFGRKVKRPVLPADYNGEDVANFGGANAEAQKNRGPINSLETQIKNDNRLSFKVPDRLVNPDPAILKAKALLEKKRQYFPIEGMCYTESAELDIHVTHGQVGRALRFMDTLIKCVRAIGHRYDMTERGNFIRIREVEIKVSFREKCNRVVIKPGAWPQTELRPSGILCFRIEGYHGAEWKDGKQNMLEDLLPKILAKLEMEARREEAWQIEIERNHQVREEKLRLEREAKERREKEIADFKDLIGRTQRWKEAQWMREFVTAVEAYPDAEPDPEWPAWALKKADWYDPLVNAHDTILNEADKRNLSSPDNR